MMLKPFSRPAPPKVLNQTTTANNSTNQILSTNLPTISATKVLTPEQASKSRYDQLKKTAGKL